MTDDEKFAQLFDISPLIQPIEAQLLDLFYAHAKFSNATFGKDGALGPIGSVKHIIAECDEILADPDDLFEYVDLMFLTFDAIRRRLALSEYSPAQFLTLARRKLVILEGRDWPDPQDGAPRFHKKNEVEK